MSDAVRDLISRVAREEGIEPAYALSTAERESSFNPNQGGTGTIRGLYQMTGALRKQYDVADDADAEAQTRGFARFTRDLRKEMQGVLGREPTYAETYTGHYFGGPRAARILSGQQANIAPTDLFSKRELAGNPAFTKHKTAGELSASVTRDMDRRMRQHSNGAPGSDEAGMIDFAQFGQAPDTPPGNKAEGSAPNPNTFRGVDFSQFGKPFEEAGALGGETKPALSMASTDKVGGKIDTRPAKPGKEIDLSQFGQPQTQPRPGKTAASPIGLPVTPSPNGTAEPKAADMLDRLDDEMDARLNLPDPFDGAFQSTVRRLQQPQPQNI